MLGEPSVAAKQDSRRTAAASKARATRVEVTLQTPTTHRGEKEAVSWAHEVGASASWAHEAGVGVAAS